MPYVSVPKDLTKIKTKVLLNLTKRQLICFSSGACLGIPIFFMSKAHVSVSTAALLMMLIMLPFFLLAMYERNGQPMEKIMHHMIQSKWIRPKKRPYQTKNLYSILARQHHLNQEVHAIVFTNNQKKKAYKKRTKTHRDGHTKGQTHKEGTSNGPRHHSL